MLSEHTKRRIHVGLDTVSVAEAFDCFNSFNLWTLSNHKLNANHTHWPGNGFRAEKLKKKKSKSNSRRGFSLGRERSRLEKSEVRKKRLHVVSVQRLPDERSARESLYSYPIIQSVLYRGFGTLELREIGLGFLPVLHTVLL